MEVITIDKVAEITRLFYDEHLRGADIAKQIGVGKSYITKIIQKDERYIEEKDYRATKSYEEIEKEWENIDNQDIKKLEFKILAIEDKTVI